MKKSTIESIKRMEKEAYDRLCKSRKQRFSGGTMKDYVDWKCDEAFHNGMMSIIDELGIDLKGV